MSDAHEFARELSQQMSDAGFRDVTTATLELTPIPAVCVLGRK